jgi:VWFA-related protein
MRRFQICWGLAAMLATAAALIAQDEAEPGAPEGAFAESVDVNVVNVEVFVTDAKGNPITGLGRGDFEILEDGRPIAITNFYAVEDRRPVATSPGSPPPAVADDLLAGGAAPVAKLPEEQRLHFVLYVDNFNIRPLNRNRVFGRLREFLRKLGPEDRVMLVTYDRSVHVRHRFTHDTAEVAAALFELEELSGFALQAERERRTVLDLIEDADSAAAVRGRVSQYASSVSNDLRFSLDALRDLIVSLAGLPGRKALLYVSDGLPMIPAQDLFYAVQRKFGDSSMMVELQQWNATRQFQQLAVQANSSGVTLYSLDATGLNLLGSSEAQHHGSSEDGLSSYVDSIEQSNLQSSIRFLAETTGGSAIVNVNDVGLGLDRIAVDFATFYSLGYTSAHSGDGRFHRIEVKVARDGARVRHRDGYRDKPVLARMSERTASSLRYGVADNPLGVVLVADEVRPQERDSYLVRLVVRIPIGNLVLIPREGFYQGRVQVHFAAMDEQGATSEVQHDTVEITIPAAELEVARGKYYAYEAPLLMHRGRHQVTVGVRDELGAEDSFVSAGVLADG